jgi:hypothetical protein
MTPAKVLRASRPPAGRPDPDVVDKADKAPNVSEPRAVEPDLRPISFNIDGAMAYTGLSRSKINELIRDDVLIVRKEGTKNLIDGDSLRRYIKSLPARNAS